jgi:hypothetical protein
LENLRGKYRVTRFYEPDFGANPNNPLARDDTGKLVRRSYWLDLPDQSVVMAMTAGVGANLTNDQKRAHLADIKRDDLVDDIIVVKILPPGQG